MLESVQLQAVPGTFGDQFAVFKDGVEVAFVGLSQVLEVAEAHQAQMAPAQISVSEGPSSKLSVYELRTLEGSSSACDALCIELGAGSVHLDRDASRALASALIAYARSEDRKRWLVRLESGQGQANVR